MKEEDTSLSIGIDIGGSHISAGYVDINAIVHSYQSIEIDGEVLTTVGLVKKIVTLIYTIINENTLLVLSQIGICCPGHCKNGIIVAAANFPLLSNINICELIAERFSNTRVILTNDADAALYAELLSPLNSLKYKGVKHAAMISIGTGIGVSLYLNSALYTGHNSLIEGGHSIIDFTSEARQCVCGQKGCVEAYASAKSMISQMNEGEQGIQCSNAKEIFNLAFAGDERAKAVLGKVDYLLHSLITFYL